ncbi:MAG: amino-acid N-acetyltransferase [Verrucomicrobiota bacterium]|nr:amino-acid N-acetyltransferase [Verrucomicrobiota bacterium]
MKISDLRGILNYVPSFREKIFVLAIDGEIIEHENFVNLVLDIAVLRSLNIKIVIVHGASHQIRQLSGDQNQPYSNDDGTGITDETTLKLSLLAANRLTHEIMEGLTSSDLRTAYANCVIAHPYGIVGGIDHQLTGKVEKVDTEFLFALLNSGVIPIVPPLGFDGDGKTYRVNSDGVALSIAEALKANKLIYLTTVDGLPNHGTIFSQLGVIEAEQYLKENSSTLSNVLDSKLRHCIRACENGVARAHIINGKQDECLLGEIFSNVGVGTMIYANEYQAIRKAQKKDVSNLLSMIKNSVQSEELIKRTRSEIVSQLPDYYVFEIDKNLVGCVALHLFPEQQAGEMACLYVKHSHENQGIGRKLMQFVETTAKDKGLKKLFALSSQAFMFFQQKAGYVEATADDLPPGRKEKYLKSKRNSKILVRSLVG